MPSLIIRSADAHDVTRLAQPEGRSPVTGRALVAEHAGEAIAAIALTSGAVLADPSRPTAAAVRRLRRRRYELLRQSGDVGPVASVLRRLVPPVAVHGA